jgi:hypothetical protein
MDMKQYNLKYLHYFIIFLLILAFVFIIININVSWALLYIIVFLEIGYHFLKAIFSSK